MLNPDNATLEWCAKWIEDSLRAETNERTIEFGRNMAMTIRAVKQETEICPVCKDEVLADSMLSYNNIPNAFCQGCVDSGRV